MERYYSNSVPETSLKIPGLNNDKWFNSRLERELKTSDLVKLPAEARVQQLKEAVWSKGTGQFFYLKLHGSYGWKAQDASDVMVIGNTKTKVIEREPLLKWYFDVFKEVLNEPERNLVVIGYGFGDEHINDIIADAIRDRQLRLYIVSPKQPLEFRNMLDPINSMGEGQKPRGREIWNGLYGFYSVMTTELYNKNTRELPPRGKQFIDALGLG